MIAVKVMSGHWYADMSNLMQGLYSGLISAFFGGIIAALVARYIVRLEKQRDNADSREDAARNAARNLLQRMMQLVEQPMNGVIVDRGSFEQQLDEIAWKLQLYIETHAPELEVVDPAIVVRLRELAIEPPVTTHSSDGGSTSTTPMINVRNCSQALSEWLRNRR